MKSSFLKLVLNKVKDHSFLRSSYLLIGIISGLLLGGGWLALAAIQSQVGVNAFNAVTGTWLPLTTTTVTPNADNETTPGTFTSGVADVDAILHGYNGVGFDRIRSSLSADGQAATGLLSNQHFLFNGATWDRRRSSSNASDTLPTNATGSANSISFPFIFNGTTFDRLRDIAISNNTTGTGIQGIAIMGFGGTNYNRLSIGSAANLTAATQTPLTIVPLSTWTETNSPAAAVQATASKAAGGGTVRHVATTITACSAQLAAAQTPIAINLRDGATGAGTILRSWKISSVIQDSKCVNLSGLAMIGTANTAMTLEFAAAGVAGSEQTVTLTGFSVP